MVAAADVYALNHVGHDHLLCGYAGLVIGVRPFQQLVILMVEYGALRGKLVRFLFGLGHGKN